MKEDSLFQHKAKLPEGIDEAMLTLITTDYYYITDPFIRTFFKQRNRDSYKGTYGHALIYAGSEGKMGAAVLAVGAALRSGAGLVSAFVPKAGYDIMQQSHPEAMLETNLDYDLSLKKRIEKFNAMAIGPGIDTGKYEAIVLARIFRQINLPYVLDAGALTVLSANAKLWKLLPDNTILTPHLGEFKALVGAWKDEQHKYQLLKDLAVQRKVIVVLKGPNTCIASPDGVFHINTTGNAGMAKGGSGDVLTGVLVALLAQGYTPLQAATLGVFVHGLAGDLAKQDLGETGMNAGDLIRFLPKAFKTFED